MPVTIQIRNLPDELHRTLKSRAALAGLPLSTYLLNVINQSAEQPTMEEFRARLAERSPVELSMSPAEMIRELRGPLPEDHDRLHENTRQSYRTGNLPAEVRGAIDTAVYPSEGDFKDSGL